MRDARIDLIGYAGELQKSSFAETLKAAVKSRMIEAAADRAQGDRFHALLVGGHTIGTVDPDKLLRLYERGKITRAQLVSAIRASNEPCRQFLSGDALAAISTEKPAAPALRIERQKGFEPTLAQAIEELAHAIR